MERLRILCYAFLVPRNGEEASDSVREMAVMCIEKDKLAIAERVRTGEYNTVIGISKH